MSSDKSKSKKKKNLQDSESEDLEEDHTVMVMDEVTSDTELKAKMSRVASGEVGTHTSDTTCQLPTPAPLHSEDSPPNRELKVPSRIMNKSTGHVYSAPRSRVRINPLKQQSKLPNRNVPCEATAANIDEPTGAARIEHPVDPETIFNRQVQEEFEPDSIAELRAICDLEQFLRPLSPEQHLVKSFLDREVDPHKLIAYMEGHMNAYYDLSVDPDPFSERRQAMDDQLWDNLAYLIPLLCRQVIEVLAKEPIIVAVQPDALVFGDVHGNFNDLHHIYKHLISNEQYREHRIVFLGDYVDRGPKPIEIVCLLFALKLTAPDRFILLRGNHEVARVNRKYGFQALCEHIFEDSYLRHPVMAKLIYQSFNRAFTHLPLGALIKSNSDAPRASIFCCHGGVPNQQLKPSGTRDSGWKIEQLNVLTGTMKPAALPPSKHVPACHLALNELLWNDPMPDKALPRYQNQLFHVNKKRGGHCSYFSEKGLKAFLETNNLAMVIRGHQYRPCKRNGFAYAFGKQLLTVFSASNYCGTESNTTGYVIVSGPTCKVVAKVLRPSEESGQFKDFNIFRIAVDEKTKKITELVY